LNLAIAAAALTGVQVGAAIVASRFVLAEVPPLTLALLRYAIGAACLLPFAWHSAAPGSWRALCASRDTLPVALLGMGQFALLIALLNTGLQTVGAARAALIFSLFPLLTLMLAAWLGQERPHLRLLAGVALSIIGVTLSLAHRLGPPAGSAAGLVTGWWGELAVLASAAVGAVCSVLYRPYLQRHAPLQVSTLAMLASVGLLAILAWPEHWPALLADLSPRAWAAVAFIGLSSGGGYFLWLYALKHESPTRVTVFLALNPATAALLGNLFLGEPADASILAALGCIALGLWLATRSADLPTGR
jgi:drug/metabolite transporter (DMT)-like permease